ncbi:MAG: helix-turn-helix transcriptional regulator [Lewinellaceae bacterium]|nr:helix-turn-helix transcriptional regulator [Lewinellaceae bacterium]
MSSSTFYRKLKSLAGLSGNEFIRTVRLKRSVDYLKSTSLNVSEVAYRVGFSDPKYFATCFKKLYHLTPSEFAEQHRKY